MTSPNRVTDQFRDAANDVGLANADRALFAALADIADQSRQAINKTADPAVFVNRLLMRDVWTHTAIETMRRSGLIIENLTSISQQSLLWERHVGSFLKKPTYSRG